jgi:hypothetical protein
MIQLTLEDADVRVLSETLQGVLSDLSYEISDTDQQDFRDGLKARRDALKRVVAAIQQTGTA